MDLNNITLPPVIIADLYKNILVDDIETANGGEALQNSVKNEMPNEILSQNSNLKFLGQNDKHISIIVNYADTVYLPDAQLSFLTNILKACKINLGDVAVINSTTYALNDATIREKLSPRVVLLFDVTPAALALPVSFPFFQVQAFDGCTYLSAPPLHELEDNKTLKTQLWNCLQKIFLP